MSTDISLVPFADIKQMAIAVANSGLFGMKKPEEALSLMLLAQAEGMHPITAARDYDIIQGRPAKKSEAMLRDFMKAGGKVEWHSIDDTGGDATFSHPVGGTVRITWDKNRAIAAELWGKAMWKKYPRQMFRSRVVSEGVRTVFPGATSGLYEVGEVQDMEPKGPPPPSGKPPIVTVDQALEKARDKGVESDLPIDTAPTEPAKPNPVKIKTGSGQKPEVTSELTGPQFTRLWAIAGNQGWQNEEVHDYIFAQWGYSSTKQLSRDQYDALIHHIETMPPNRKQD
jgi:hypothetical protein